MKFRLWVLVYVLELRSLCGMEGANALIGLFDVRLELLLKRQAVLTRLALNRRQKRQPRRRWKMAIVM